VIVTSDLKDFPPQQIPKPLTVISPKEFAADTVAVSPDIAHRAVIAVYCRRDRAGTCRCRRDQPQGLTPDHAMLKTQGLSCCCSHFTAQIRDRWIVPRMD
jgi:hypothetical protein